jgi:putative transposase
LSHEWEQVAIKRPQVELDTWIVMADHFHGIVFLHSQSEWDGTPLNYARPDSLSAIIGAFKAAVSREINRMRQQETIAWQRSFHDRVIRDANELDAFRRYIIENPSRWNINSET